MAPPKILKEPWPFGALMVAYWVLPLIILVTMWPLPGSFYSAISWLALVTSFASWIIVIFGFQAKPVKLSERYVLIPYLQIDVILACFYSALFLLSAYGCYSTLALSDLSSALIDIDLDVYSGLKPRVIIAAVSDAGARA
ncbi:hypothetical protein AAVH_30866 [Aphelenchoides avenae]|nr:hypothetical protein AAVH_30866 [Aphelenchus avenae]